ncbi:hypothetical protein CVIRNUC_000216 [Coccomyxa viridis]|uniref:Secreted protein n=1 Tax=Coccomyxa viridis TaxID=1274662 RepID=A0AAV1HR82_9CHLO|nr:hypothetical protein CVIRNUC_000216 [Coccomyxa viridis]
MENPAPPAGTRHATRPTAAPLWTLLVSPQLCAIWSCMHSTARLAVKAQGCAGVTAMQPHAASPLAQTCTATVDAQSRTAPAYAQGHAIPW